MSGSDRWEVPVDDLATIDSTLNTVSTELEAVESGATGVEGTDDVHGERLLAAVESFFAEWEASRKVLIDNVGVLGDISGQIAQTVNTFDQDTAGALGEMGAELQKGLNG